MFGRLRGILKKHADGFTVAEDAPDNFTLEGPIGPATLQAWGGKERSQTIPVAWARVGKAYVSFHLMGVYGNPKLLGDCSTNLKAHMQGKSFFNFKTLDDPLFVELERLTLQSLAGMKRQVMSLASDRLNTWTALAVRVEVIRSGQNAGA